MLKELEKFLKRNGLITTNKQIRPFDTYQIKNLEAVYKEYGEGKEVLELAADYLAQNIEISRESAKNIGKEAAAIPKSFMEKVSQQELVNAGKGLVMEVKADKLEKKLDKLQRKSDKLTDRQKEVLERRAQNDKVRKTWKSRLADDKQQRKSEKAARKKKERTFSARSKRWKRRMQEFGKLTDDSIDLDSYQSEKIKNISFGVIRKSLKLVKGGIAGGVRKFRVISGLHHRKLNKKISKDLKKTNKKLSKISRKSIVKSQKLERLLNSQVSKHEQLKRFYKRRQYQAKYNAFKLAANPGGMSWVVIKKKAAEALRLIIKMFLKLFGAPLLILTMLLLLVALLFSMCTLGTNNGAVYGSSYIDSNPRKNIVNFDNFVRQALIPAYEARLRNPQTYKPEVFGALDYDDFEINPNPIEIKYDRHQVAAYMTAFFHKYIDDKNNENNIGKITAKFQELLELKFEDCEWHIDETSDEEGNVKRTLVINIKEKSWDEVMNNDIVNSPHKDADKHFSDLQKSEGNMPDLFNSEVKIEEVSQYLKLPGKVGNGGEISPYGRTGNDVAALAAWGIDPNYVSANAQMAAWGQCVWGAYNILDQWGYEVPPMMGNGGEWAANAQARGIPTTYAFQAGQAYCVKKGHLGSSSVYGHISVIAEVYDNGDILILESNFSTAGIYSTRRLTAQEAMNNGVAIQFNKKGGT